MAIYQKGQSTPLTKTALQALTSAVTSPVYLKVNADVMQTFTQDGSKFEKAESLLFHSGQVILQADIDALYQAATVSTVSPATGTTAGGTAVTITGTNFSGATGVTFGGTAATAVTVVNNTTITCTAPAHAAGAVNVVVADDAGSVTATNAFTYA